MSVVETPSRLRDRRRAETVADIKRAALAQVDAGGHEAMTLRAVARDVGVSVQALYHYFPSRDALLTDLIADSYNGLADAVARAVPQGIPDRTERAVAAGLAYRSWAFAHRSQFLLALGVPVTDYAAPRDGPTSLAAQRLGQVFREVLFAGTTIEQLRRIPLPDYSLRLDTTLSAAVAPPPGLPPGAFAYFTCGWAVLHGLVMLELLGHVPWVGDAGEEMCRLAMVTFTGQVNDALDTAP